MSGHVRVVGLDETGALLLGWTSVDSIHVRHQNQQISLHLCGEASGQAVIVFDANYLLKFNLHFEKWLTFLPGNHFHSLCVFSQIQFNTIDEEEQTFSLPKFKSNAKCLFLPVC